MDEDREGIDDDNDDFETDSSIEDENDDGDKNDIDAILDTIIQRMRSLEENTENISSVKEVVASVMQERNQRVKRDAEDITGAEKRSSNDEIGILSKTLAERSHLSNNPQTVGTLLATIPGILDEHGLSFDAISKHLFNFEKSLEDTLKSGLSKIAEKVGENGKENSDKLGDIGETLHNGLDLIAEKMEYSANIEDTLHDGFHSISEKLDDKSQLDDTIHEGLHEISEKLETVNSYGLKGIINNLDKHHPVYPPGHGHGDGHDHHVSIHGSHHGHPHILSEISTDLKGIITSIGEHKDELVNTLTEKEAIARLEEIAEEETKQEIIAALEGMTSALTSGQDNLAVAVNTGHDKVASAITSGHTVLADAFEEGSETVSKSIEDGTEDLADTFESSISGAADKMSTSITSGNSAISSAITSGNSDLVLAMTTGNDKISNSNLEIAKEITAGNTKVAESIDDTKSSLETLKADLTNSISTSNGLVATAITTGDGKIEAALLGNKEAITNVKNSLDTQNTRLETGFNAIAGNIESAGEENSLKLSDVASNIKENADNLLKFATDTNTGLTGLAGNVENAANSIGSLTALAATSNTDTKAALQSISSSIDGAAGHLQSSASQTSNIAATLNTFSSDTQNSINNIKTALEAAGSSNDASINAVKGAIDDFKNTADSDTADIISAMNLYKDTLGEGMTNLQEELDEIETAITNAQVRQTQLNAVERLANKIECTTDCYVSSEQAHAIVRGLDKNDKNVEALVDDINSAAANLPTETPANGGRWLPPQSRIMSESYPEQNSDYETVDNPSFGANILDTAIALQNTNGELTKKLQSRGYNIQRFNEIFEKLIDSPNALHSFSSEFDELMETANITIPKSLNLQEYLSRKGRSILAASKSSKAIRDLHRILTRNTRHASSETMLDFDRLKNITEVYKFTDKSNEEVIQKVSRHVRTIQPSQLNPKSDDFWEQVEATAMAAMGKLITDGIAGTGTYQLGSLDAATALKELYDGSDNDKFNWKSYRPTGHLTPNNFNWIKDDDEIDG